MPVDLHTIAAQADLCRLLAACYYEPAPEFIEERVFEAMSEAAERLGPDMARLAQPLKAAFEAESQENLLVDYAKLFLGPGETLAPPYESAWRDANGESSVDATQALLELYAQGGFELDPDFLDLPDHVAVELEFLYTVLFQMAVGVSNKDQSVTEGAQGLLHTFLERHLMVWVEPFSTALKEGAECEFYRCLAELTRAFVQLLLRR